MEVKKKFPWGTKKICETLDHAIPDRNISVGKIDLPKDYMTQDCNGIFMYLIKHNKSRKRQEFPGKQKKIWFEAAVVLYACFFSYLMWTHIS